MKKLILFAALLLASISSYANVYPDTATTNKPFIWGDFLGGTYMPTTAWFNTDYFDDVFFKYDSAYVAQDSSLTYAWYYKGTKVYDKQDITVLMIDTLMTDITTDSVTIIFDSLYTRIAYNDLLIFNDSSKFFVQMQVAATLDTLTLDTLNYTWTFMNGGRKRYLPDGSFVRVYPFIAFYMNWQVQLRFASIRELVTDVPLVNISNAELFTNAYKVEVYNMHGRLVDTSTNENVRLLQGLHIYKISKGNNTITRKIYGNRN